LPFLGHLHRAESAGTSSTEGGSYSLVLLCQIASFFPECFSDLI
jgi:hypothetical protein